MGPPLFTVVAMARRYCGISIFTSSVIFFQRAISAASQALASSSEAVGTR